jgi:hypothetical protein
VRCRRVYSELQSHFGCSSIRVSAVRFRPYPSTGVTSTYAGSPFTAECMCADIGSAAPRDHERCTARNHNVLRALGAQHGLLVAPARLPASLLSAGIDVVGPAWLIPRSRYTYERAPRSERVSFRVRLDWLARDRADLPSIHTPARWSDVDVSMDARPLASSGSLDEDSSSAMRR